MRAFFNFYYFVKKRKNSKDKIDDESLDKYKKISVVKPSDKRIKDKEMDEKGNNNSNDISNEENGTDIKPFTKKQTGRLLTEIGLENATQTLNDTVIESTKSEEKNA